MSDACYVNQCKCFCAMYAISFFIICINDAMYAVLFLIMCINAAMYAKSFVEAMH